MACFESEWAALASENSEISDSRRAENQTGGLVAVLQGRPHLSLATR